MTDEKCKHNGGKGYWSNLSGFKCLKCGAEVQEELKNTMKIETLKTLKEIGVDYADEMKDPYDIVCGSFGCKAWKRPPKPKRN